MNKYFTKKQMKTLEPARIYFYTTIYEQWKRNTPMSLNNTIADVYFEATGKMLQPNWSCASCNYNNYLTVGKMFFESEEYYKQQDNEKVDSETEPKPETKQTKKTVAKSAPKKTKKKK